MASEPKGGGLQRKPSRVLKATATVDRIVRPRPEDWTGEWRVESQEVWHGDESRKYVPALKGAGGKIEQPTDAAPARPPRERGSVEIKLRLLAGLSLLLFIVVASASGGVQLIARFTAEVPAQRWREVEVQLSSVPSGAEVFIEGESRGKTPLTLQEYCRARVVRVRVTTQGYASWTWHGVCPKKGVLVLRANLQALGTH
ncbi:MAG: PEGA domain-containing protein [Deltaproteobacteria bacterium]|nr:PEGA domain-containing protein [Deltaproteobacteria bacterium]